MPRGKTHKPNTVADWFDGHVKHIALALFTVAVVAIVTMALRHVPEPALAGMEPSNPAASSAPTEAPVVAFIGDSYTHGTGSSGQAHRWTTVLSAAEGWREVNLGRGGTGYLTTASMAGCGLKYCPNYQEMVDDAAAVGPNIVFVAGGQNDFATFAEDRQPVFDAIEKTFKTLRAKLPSADIVAVGPSTPGEVDDEVIAFDEAVQKAAASVKAKYVSLIDPNVITDTMHAPDGGHVNDSGHAAIAERIRKALG